MYGKLLFHGSRSHVGRSMNFLLHKYNIRRDQILGYVSPVIHAIKPATHRSDTVRATASTIQELLDIRDQRLTAILEPAEIEMLIENLCK